MKVRQLSSGLLVLVCIMFANNCKQSTKSINRNNIRNYNDIYENEYLNYIAFPIGGIGAGMFCLEGTGTISHMSVRNRPAIFNQPCMFAAIALKGVNNGAKILEGPVPDWKKYGLPGSGYGTSYNWSNLGLPRFEDAKFLSRFPFAYIDLFDSELPIEVRIKGWSPFIPTDADDSSLPVGAIEYSFKNSGSQTMDAVFSYNSSNFMGERASGKGSITSILNGFVLSEEGTETSPENQGDFAVFTNDPNTVVDHCWFRGSFVEGLTMVWNTISNGEIKDNPPDNNEAQYNLRPPGASLFVPFSLDPNETKVIRVSMAWYVPNTKLRILFPRYAKEINETDGDNNMYDSQYYKPWYSGKFANITEVVSYWTTNYEVLQKKSELFKESFYDNTLPPEVTEAVSADLSILKSPTILRQPDGKLWCWEGSGDESGSCEGSCTHVWNYAQAIPHLFPELERTLRETEFFINQDQNGHQHFRASLPIRRVTHAKPADHSFWAAADGQLGGIIKVYRDWRINGNAMWLSKIFPRVIKSMDFCINYWDPRHTGTIEEPHLNTYDVIFWGPDGMTTSIYLGALRAIIEMGKYLGEDIHNYEILLERGREFMENELFNGEYFIQKTKWNGLSSADPIEVAKMHPPEKLLGPFWYSQEALELFKREGPKMQYGSGCLSDGILGCWLAEVSGLENIIDPNKINSHLLSVYKYNFKENLNHHANPARNTFALGDDGGLIICSWPKGNKLTIPFDMSSEVWTGIEYQVAAHLIFTGQVEKGLEIIRKCRDRYDGRSRNPFDEYECGHWYGRALSSYSLLQALTGVRYDAVEQVMYIDSRIGDFKSFISTETGFGSVGVQNGQPFCTVVYGDIPIRKFALSIE